VKHTVALDAVSGDERVRVHLFLPKRGSPPYQTVVFFPAADAFLLRSSRDMSMAAGEFILRSGRAFLYPVYKGTYERAIPDEMGSNAERDLHIAWSRDLGRAIDYPGDATGHRPHAPGLYGVSAGADRGDPDGSRAAPDGPACSRGPGS
jgi:hypothetical protein